ncbi:MAG: N-acetylmuramoyl-L-alanine amidase [Clostridiales bacterium]|nr:N-acetylmuramoyl-L-alanine amidase [Clostridiales bacterium]
MKLKQVDVIRKERLLAVLYAVVIAAGLWHTNSIAAVQTFSFPTEKKVILIDAGHGGWDPGKVGRNDTLEKDLNLAIMEKLQMMLEQGGAYTVTTRATDDALSKNKRTDLSARKNMAYDYKADILVSIHQNSYPQASVKGAQVFYFDNSDKSKLLAESIQSRIVSFLDPGNVRGSKANDNYYLLKKTAVPAVIVECGFLTNETDRQNLLEDDYQEKIAWSIYMGIVDYFEALDAEDAKADSYNTNPN